jgi:tripartite-type tricarboxylate transporter receptor subunit TctC
MKGDGDVEPHQEHCGLSALLALGAMPVTARAQAYPNRPITLVIPLPPAAPTTSWRVRVADKLSTALGQQIVIENRAAGGSGTVGTTPGRESAPDGYTLLLGYTSTLATAQACIAAWATIRGKDFAPIGLSRSRRPCCWCIRACRSAMWAS